MILILNVMLWTFLSTRNCVDYCSFGARALQGYPSSCTSFGFLNLLIECDSRLKYLVKLLGGGGAVPGRCTNTRHSFCMMHFAAIEIHLYWRLRVCFCSHLIFQVCLWELVLIVVSTQRVKQMMGKSRFSAQSPVVGKWSVSHVAQYLLETDIHECRFVTFSTTRTISSWIVYPMF